MTEDVLNILVKVDGATRSGVVHRIVNSNNKYKIYEVVSNEDGESTINLPIGVYTVTSTFKPTIETSVEYSEVKSEIVVKDNSRVDDENLLEVSITGCDSGVLLDKTCKYFYHDPYWTPNNYDLYFDYQNIPVNIITETPHSLHQRLQNCLPLTKILHLNLDVDDEYQSNSIHIHSNVNVNYNSYNVTVNNNIYYPTVTCRWNNDILEDYYYDYYTNILRKDLDTLLENYTLTNSLSESEYENLLHVCVESCKTGSNYDVSETTTTEDTNNDDGSEETDNTDNNNSTSTENNTTDNTNSTDNDNDDEDDDTTVTRNSDLETSLRDLFDNVIGTGEESTLIYIAVKYDDPNNTVDIPSLDDTARENLINLGEALTENVEQAFIDRNHDLLYGTYDLTKYYHQITCSIYRNQTVVKENIILNDTNTWKQTLTETLEIYGTTQNNDLDYNSRPNYSVRYTPMKYIFECTECGRLYYGTVEEYTNNECEDCENTLYEQYPVCSVILETLDPSIYKNTKLKIL